MNVQRHISPFESAYFREGGPLPLFDMPIFMGSAVRGAIDPGTAEEVLIRLAARHPLLRCRVVDGEEGHILRLDGEFRPRVETGEGGESAHLELVNSRPDWRNGLFQAHILSDGEVSRIVLVIHHGVADGRSSFALLNEFWQCYTALAGGAELPAVVERALPDAIDARLAGVFKDDELDALAVQMAAGAAAGGPGPVALPVDGVGRPRAGDDSPRFVIDRTEFDRETSAAVVAAARSHGITVNGLVAGALMVAVREQLDLGPEPVPMVCGHAVDLRSRVTPELTSEDVLNCVAGLLTPVEVSGDDRAADVGRKIHASLAAALERGDAERFMLASLRATPDALPPVPAPAPVPATEPVPMVSYGFSNVGRIAPHPTPEGVEFLRIEVSGNAPGMPPKLGSFTVDGRITLQNEYDSWVYDRDRMRRLIASVRGALEKSLAC
ncbi:hypothetical protein [Streptomyces sp. NPDC020667]|uniref:phthiocerol/phthiodiolone dimycocerosyl transferase family protein n=1 Tax=Streptomyces sp. NPDC020667 TaxID=3154895 RepID=UPI0033EFF3B8